MKVICEVILQVRDYQKSQFSWLRNRDENILFVIEEGKRLRMVSVRNEPAREIQSASLAEARLCTNLNWNRTQSLLTIVVDKRQIYFWEVQKNSFIYFKPQSGFAQASSGADHHSGTSSSSNLIRKSHTKDIELVVWSKRSDKLAICYTSGQILLCKFGNNLADVIHKKSNTITSTWEKFIDNSESVLKRIVAIEVSEHSDLFACFSVISEILVMTFDGQTKFYSQCDGLRLLGARFGPPVMKFSNQTRGPQEQYTWLAYQSSNDGLSFKMISINQDAHDDMAPRLDTILQANQRIDSSTNVESGSSGAAASKLICFHWLTTNRLLACFSNGVVLSVQLQYKQNTQRIGAGRAASSIAGYTMSPLQSPEPNMSPGLGIGGGGGVNSSATGGALSLLTEEILYIDLDNGDVSQTDTNPSVNETEPNSNGNPEQFQWFELKKLSQSSSSYKSGLVSTPNGDTPELSYALVAGTEYRLFYYELYEVDNKQFYAEKVDDLDLSGSLKKLQFKLERAKWSDDCSMLAVQLTSGHILIYRTRLGFYLVTSHGPRTAYLSGTNEITILNYGKHRMFASSPTIGEQYGHDATRNSSVRPQSVGSMDTTSLSLDQSSISPSCSSPLGAQSENASILNVNIRPSLLSIGPKHLALALNNRVRFYPLDLIQASSALPQTTESTNGAAASRATTPSSLNSRNTNDEMEESSSSSKQYIEQEYVTVVIGLSLNSSFVGAMFADGRLKLHSIRQRRYWLNGVRSKKDEKIFREDDNVSQTEERFFPDPSQPEQISAFVLTEELLVYSTREFRVNVFSLHSWNTIQICDHSQVFRHNCIITLKPNERGNKFVCLLGTSRSRGEQPRSSLSRLSASTTADTHRVSQLANTDDENAYLYDVYSNGVYSLSDSKLYEQLCQQMIDDTLKLIPYNLKRLKQIVREELGEGIYAYEGRRKKFNQILDAVWDNDGRTVLLIERKQINVVAILDHTLERDGPVGILASSSDKPSGYTTLYASHGIVSFQSSLGRVVNSILKTHDDDLTLSQLESKFQLAKKRMLAELNSQLQNSLLDNESTLAETKSIKYEPPKVLETHLRMMCMKMAYLRSILPIYGLPRCREICEHLMSENQLNIGDELLDERILYDPRQIVERQRLEQQHQRQRLNGDNTGLKQTMVQDNLKNVEENNNNDNNKERTRRSICLINKLIWLQLAAWSLFVQNLNYASLIYGKYNLPAYAFLLDDILDELKFANNDSQLELKGRLLNLLGLTNAT